MMLIGNSSPDLNEDGNSRSSTNKLELYMARNSRESIAPGAAHKCSNCSLHEQRLKKCRKWMEFMSKDLVNAHRFLHIVASFEEERERHLDLQLAYDQRTREWAQLNEEMIALLHETQPLRNKLRETEDLLEKEICKREKFQNKSKASDEIIKQLNQELARKERYNPSHIETLEKKLHKTQEQNRFLKTEKVHLTEEKAEMYRRLSTIKQQNETLHKKLYWGLNMAKSCFLLLKDYSEDVALENEPKLSCYIEEEVAYLKDLYDKYEQEEKRRFFIKTALTSFDSWVNNHALMTEAYESDEELELPIEELEAEAAKLQDLLIESPQITAFSEDSQCSILERQNKKNTVMKSDDFESRTMSSSYQELFTPENAKASERGVLTLNTKKEISSEHEKERSSDFPTGIKYTKEVDHMSDPSSPPFSQSSERAVVSKASPSNCANVLNESFDMDSSSIIPEKQCPQQLETKQDLCVKNPSVCSIFDMLSESNDSMSPSPVKNELSFHEEDVNESSFEFELVKEEPKRKSENLRRSARIARTENKMLPKTIKREDKNPSFSQTPAQRRCSKKRSLVNITNEMHFSKATHGPPRKKLRTERNTLSPISKDSTVPVIGIKKEKDLDSFGVSGFELQSNSSSDTIPIVPFNAKTEKNLVEKSSPPTQASELNSVLFDLDMSGDSICLEENESKHYLSPMITPTIKREEFQRPIDGCVEPEASVELISDVPEKTSTPYKIKKESVYLKSQDPWGEPVNKTQLKENSTPYITTYSPHISESKLKIPISPKSCQQTHSNSINVKSSNHVEMDSSSSQQTNLSTNCAVTSGSLVPVEPKEAFSLFFESTGPKKILISPIPSSPIPRKKRLLVSKKIISSPESPNVTARKRPSRQKYSKFLGAPKKELFKEVTNRSISVEEMSLVSILKTVKNLRKPVTAIEDPPNLVETETKSIIANTVTEQAAVLSTINTNMNIKTENSPKENAPVYFDSTVKSERFHHDDDVLYINESQENIECMQECTENIQEEPSNIKASRDKELDPENFLNVISDVEDPDQSLDYFPVAVDSDEEGDLIIDDFAIEPSLELDPENEEASLVEHGSNFSSKTSPAHTIGNQAEDKSNHASIESPSIKPVSKIKITQSIQACRNSVGLEDDTLSSKLLNCVEYMLSAATLHERKQSMKDIIQVLLNDDQNTRVALKAVMKVIVQTVLASNTFERKDNSNALPRTIYKCLQLIRIIEINLKERPFSLFEFVQQMCHKLVISNISLRPNSLASLANLYFASSYIGYQRSKHNAKEYLVAGRQYLTEMLLHHKGKIHLSLIGILNCSRMTFIRNIRTRETTPLEKVMIWIFEYGQWDGSKAIRDEVVELLAKQKLNIRSSDHLGVLTALIKAIIDDATSDLKSNTFCALRLFFTWVPFEDVFAALPAALKINFRNLQMDCTDQNSIDILKDIAGTVKIRFDEHLRGVHWTKEQKGAFMKKLSTSLLHL